MPLRTKSILANASLVVLSLAIFFLAGEAAFRIWYGFKTPTFELDQRLGWRTRPDLSLTYDVRDSGGVPSTVTLKTDGRGFRVWGDPNTERPKIFVIGDSFTFAKDVTQDQTYYARLADSLDAEFFVYGCEGYATLQELMILERYLEAVQPDLVLWQFCWNDFIGNSPTLERGSVINNNGMRRPYLDAAGDVVYRTPRAFGAFRSFAQRHSRLLYSVLFRADALLGLSHVDAASESIIESRGGAYAPYEDAVARTATLLRRAASVAESAPIWVFDVAQLQPYSGDLREVCPEADVTFVAGVGEAIDAARANGEQVYAGDGAHWNAAGHAICADVLRPRLDMWLADRGRIADRE